MNKVLKEKDFRRKFPIKLVKHKSEWITSYEDEKTNLDACKSLLIDAGAIREKN